MANLANSKPFNPLGSDRPTLDPVMDMGWAISRGYVQGHSRFSKNGYNMDIDDAEEDIWMVGGTYVWPAAAQRMEIVSSSANDTATTGSGVRTVLISYLDSTWTPKTERLALNGVTAVPTVATDILRVNAFRADTVGAGGKAAGNIDIRHLDDTPIYSRIGVGHTRARNCAYCVPLGYELYITQITYASNATAAGHFARFTFRTTYDEQEDSVGTVFFPFSEIAVQDATFTITYPVPMRFPEKTCMNISAIGEAPNCNIVASAQYRGYLVQHGSSI